jgi:hypothetical protein
VRKFDPNGQPAATERVMVQETKLPDGGSKVQETTYRSDLNGGVHEAERKVTETHVSGTTTTANTVIDRPGISGTFETIEKRSSVTDGPVDNQRTTESIYRGGISGGFQEALRTVRTESKSNDITKGTTASYEPSPNGQLQLSSQTASTTTKLPDGSQTTQTDVFSRNVAGDVQDNSAAMRVREQQILQRRTNPDGSVAETLSVRRPTPADPNRLGAPQKVSETVCTGKCVPAAAAPPAKP